MADALFNIDNFMAVLEDLARDAENAYKDNIRNHDHIASGILLQSIHTTIEVRGTTYIVWMEMDDTWKYVEYDTKPHWPPRDAILQWIRIKPVLPSPDENGRIPSQESLAFLISRAMAGESPNPQKKGGTKGTHDFQTARDGVTAFYEERLLEALERDVLDYVERVLP